MGREKLMLVYARDDGVEHASGVLKDANGLEVEFVRFLWGIFPVKIRILPIQNSVILG